MLQRKQWWVASMTAVLWQQILVGRECVPCMGLQIWFIRVSKICQIDIYIIYILYYIIKSAVLAELPSWIQSVGRSSQQGIAGGVEVMFGNLEKSYSWNEIPPSTMRVLARWLNSETWRNTWQPRLQLEKRRNPFPSWNVEACAVWRFCLLAPKVHSSHWCQHHRWDEGRLHWGLFEETRRNRSPTSRVRPQWVNHPPRRSQSPSTAPLSDCPAACLVGHQSDMVSLGLVQGCFKMYWGLLRVGFRVGLRFLQGFLIVCFRVYLGLT